MNLSFEHQYWVDKINVCWWVNDLGICFTIRVTGVDCGDTVGEWISEVLNKPGCRLIQQDRTRSRKCKLDKTTDGKKFKKMVVLVNLWCFV